LTSFYVKSNKILTTTFFSHIGNKLAENDVGKVWVQNHVILGWFGTSVGFRVKSHKILTGIFLSRLNEKQLEIDPKACGDGLGAKPSHLG